MIHAYTLQGDTIVRQVSDHAADIDGLQRHDIDAVLPSVHMGSTLHVIAGAFYVEGPSLASLKASKRSEINEARLAANQGTFEFMGKQISCDALSRGDIDGMTSEVAMTGALPATFPGFWKTEDNSYLPIPDVATWKQLVQAMVAQGAANFMKSQSLKAQLDAATTPEEVSAIAW